MCDRIRFATSVAISTVRKTWSVTEDINYHLEEPKKKVARKNQETKTNNREKGNQYEQHVYVEQDFTFPIFSFEDDFLNETTTTGMVV